MKATVTSLLACVVVALSAIAETARSGARVLLVTGIDRTNTHDPRGLFTVQIADLDHAITRGLQPFEVDDELYVCLTGEKPIDVLATARSKITNRDHPMAFVHRYGKGRVFQTPLGHDVKALRSGLEIVVHGFRAPYAFDIDPWGHVWHISNGEGSPNLFVHVIPGLDYGYASRPASYSWLAGNEPLSPPVHDMGAGANTAALHYYASMFPRKYWGNIFVANWGSHGENPSNREILRFRRAKGSEDRTGTSDTELLGGEKFLTSADSKFRPTGLALAPDGGLYVLDWHGRDDENDKTGRILKIVYASRGRSENQRISRIEQLLTRLGDTNDFIRDRARRELAKRGDVAVEPLGRILEFSDAFHAAQAAWALTQIRTPAAAHALTSGLKHADSRVRAHALRQLRQAAGQALARDQLGVLDPGHSSGRILISPDELARVAAPLLDDADAEVRIEAALAQTSSVDVTSGLLAALAAHPHRRLVYQIAFQLSRNADAAVIARLVKSTGQAERYAALIAIDNARHERTPLFAALQASAPALLEEAPPAEFSKKLAWLSRRDPATFEIEWERLESGEVQLVSAAERVAALVMLASFPPRNVPARYLGSALRDRDAGVRQAALRAVRAAASDHAGFCAPTLELAKSGKPDWLRLEAVWTLGALRDAGTAEDWMELVENPSTRITALRALRQRRSAPEITDALLTRAAAIGQQGDAAEDLLLTLQALGVSLEQCSNTGLNVAPRDKQQFAEAVLRRLPSASPSLGRLSFDRLSCSQCHATGSGETSFGPNVSNIGGVSQPEYVIESILDPSRVIKTGFELDRIETSDGQTAIGLVEVRGNVFAVKVAPNQVELIDSSKVRSRTASRLSAMPEGLDAGCSVLEMGDIVAYLMSLGAGSPRANSD